LGDKLLLPSVLLRSGETVLLDDLDIKDIEDSLEINVTIVDSESGYDFVNKIIE
jgi:NifB/MoaA-like Fe-S oxidoreductase